MGHHEQDADTAALLERFAFVMSKCDCCDEIRVHVALQTDQGVAVVCTSRIGARDLAHKLLRVIAEPAYELLMGEGLATLNWHDAAPIEETP